MGRITNFRISSSLGVGLLVFALAACGNPSASDNDSSGDVAAPATDDASMRAAEKEAALQAAEDGRIDCALAGATEFSRNCEVERVSDDDGQILIVRHPDGGFRRFRVLTDGRGLELAEGFDDQFALKITDDQMIEVTSGGDIYRLPAQIKSAPKKAESEVADSKEADAKAAAE